MNEHLEAMLAEVVEFHGEGGRSPFLAYVDYHGAEYATVEEFTDTYRGEYDNAREHAEELIIDTGMLDGVNETVARYFDLAAYARDLELGGDIYTVPAPSGRVYVFWTL